MKAINKKVQVKAKTKSVKKIITEVLDKLDLKAVDNGFYLDRNIKTDKVKVIVDRVLGDSESFILDFRAKLYATDALLSSRVKSVGCFTTDSTIYPRKENCFGLVVHFGITFEEEARRRERAKLRKEINKAKRAGYGSGRHDEKFTTNLKMTALLGHLEDEGAEHRDKVLAIKKYLNNEINLSEVVDLFV